MGRASKPAGLKSLNRPYIAPGPFRTHVAWLRPGGSLRTETLQLLDLPRRELKHLQVDYDFGRVPWGYKSSNHHTINLGANPRHYLSLESWKASRCPATPWTERAGALSPIQMQRARKEKVNVNRPAPAHTMTTWTKVAPKHPHILCACLHKLM